MMKNVCSSFAQIIFLLCGSALLLLLNSNYCSGAIHPHNSTQKSIKDNNNRWTSSSDDRDAIWGPLLEEWTVGGHRNKRVMQPTQNGYIMRDRIADETVEMNESKIYSGGKIVASSNPTNNGAPPVKKQPGGRPISETDLYLLGAIEKLVYRTDFMEKRLRRVEEMLYYLMAGNRVVPEPCVANFTRIGSNCYMFSNAAGREYDWKVASKQCKRQGAVLAELETIEENQDVVAYIQNNQHLRGKDYWTGGLNPGLLWIWSNSARPVPATTNDKNSSNAAATIAGDGRCLRLAYNPALHSYAYRGSDCSVRYSYVCEIPENTASNEIRRLGRSRKILDEL